MRMRVHVHMEREQRYKEDKHMLNASKMKED